MKQYQLLKGPTMNDLMHQQRNANYLHQIQILYSFQHHINICSPLLPFTVAGLSPPSDDMYKQFNQMENSINQYQQLLPFLCVVN